MQIAAAPAARNATLHPATSPIVVRMGTPTIGALASAPIVQPSARLADAPLKRVPAMASESPGTVASLTAPGDAGKEQDGKNRRKPKDQQASGSRSQSEQDEAARSIAIGKRAGHQGERR